MVKENQKLLVSRIEITNILGIKHLEFKPGAGLTVATGENQAGKTSLLEAIRSIFKGGQDVSLLRRGAEKGEIVLELSDGVKIERTVTAGKSATMITHPEFGQISKPATYLELLIDKLGMNPVDFLTAPAKMRTQLLLEAMPIKLDPALIEPIIGHEVDPLDTNALELIAREIKKFYDDRTGVNRVAKEKRATILQMKQTLPTEDEDTDFSRVVSGVEKELNAQRISLQDALDLARSGILQEKLDLSTGSQTKVDEVKRKLEEQINLLRTNADKEIEKIQKAFNEKRDNIEGDGQVRINEIEIKYQPKISGLEGKLAVARENLANQSKINQTKEYIATLTTDAVAAEAQSERDTDTIEKLEKLKTSLLETLPIKGIEIKDGEIFVDAVPFDRVNTARKVEIAMDIAQLRSGKLPLMIVDGLELMDSKTFAAFVAAAKKSKVQMIVTRVSDQALKVEA